MQVTRLNSKLPTGILGLGCAICQTDVRMVAAGIFIELIPEIRDTGEQRCWEPEHKVKVIVKVGRHLRPLDFHNRTEYT